MCIISVNLTFVVHCIHDAGGMDMNFDFLGAYGSLYWQGIGVTLFLSFFAVLVGTLIGIFIAIGKLSNNIIIKGISSGYIEILRGTPLLVQVYIFVYGLPYLGIQMPDIAFCILALSINSSAYIAEIIRSGIQSVDKGQMEAARTLGLNYWKAIGYIILPQGIKNILPALGNEFITLIKESAIVSVVGIHDIMYGAETVRGITFSPFAPLIVAAGIYFAITFTLSKVVGRFERGMTKDVTN